MVNFLNLAPSGQTNPSLLLSQNLLAPRRTPRSTAEGIGAVTRDLVGAFLARRGLEQQQQREQAAAGTLSQALTTALGRPAEDVRNTSFPPDPDTGFQGIQFQEQPPRPQAALQSLLSNPSTANSGLTAALLGQQLEGAGEQFEPVRDAAGNIVGQRSSLSNRVFPDPRNAARVAAAGATSVSVDARQFPKGFVPARDPDTGEPLTTIVETPEGPARVPVAVPLEGGEEARKRQEAQEKKAAKQGKQERQANRVIDAINGARETIKGETLLSPATGLPGAVASVIPGTRSVRLRGFLDTIRANIGFNELNAMREASTSGASGLGQVTENERAALEASQASLDPDLGDEQLLKNLDIVEADFRRIITPTISQMSIDQLRRLDPSKLTAAQEQELGRRMDELGIP